MNVQQFIEKLHSGDFEYFRRETTADFVVKDETGQAWMIDCIDFDEEDIVPAAIYDIQACGWEPFKVSPVFGIVGYKRLEG
nr:MAG TPA: hypothetical protein [Caudoviricetes sp.]